MMNILKYKKLSYILKEPNDYKKDKKYPVIIFVHGSGSRGTDITLLENNPFFKNNKADILCPIIYAPQCYTDTWFDIYEQLTDFVKFVIEQPSTDADRVILMGASMGGYAVWQLAMSNPEYYAAIVPICGGGMYWNAPKLKNMNIWAFHGNEDTSVLCAESIKMINTINYFGGKAKLTVYENTGHDSWTKAYNTDDLFKWLINCRRQDTVKIKKLENPNIYG